MTLSRRALFGLLPAALAACTSPNPELFVLVAVPGPKRHLDVRSVELRRIGLAGYLDRPEIVRSAADYRVHVASNQRWGESLGTMLERVFNEDLVERLPGIAVFTEASAISTAPDLVLELDVQRLDTDASGMLVLLAQAAVRRADARQPAHAETIRLTKPPASPATADLVAAMSLVLGELADRVVVMLAHA